MTNIVSYLEMNTPDEFIPSQLAISESGLRIEEVRHPQPTLNRLLYQWVGADYAWTDRLAFTSEEWHALVTADDLRTWLAYYQGAVAGYFELRQCDSDTELLYFGLTPDFIGRGLGSVLLSAAVQEAWQWSGTLRVWCHTCSRDHKHALRNYLARGFQLYRTEQDG